MKNNKRKYRPMKYLMNAFLVGSIGLLALSCGEEKKESETLLRPVKYNEVGFLGGQKVRVFSGTARTDKIINLSFRNSGIITLFDMKLGQKAKKGQLLAKLDNVQSRLAYEQAVTQLNSAASQMNTSKLNLNRIRSLYEKGSTSLSDFEAAKNSFKNAEEGYKSAQRGVEIQQDQINYGYIYAPEDGIVASISAEIDENVQPGQSVAILNAGTDMEISLGLPESVINRVAEGMKVNIDFSSLPGETFEGKVTEVAPAVDANTATYPIRVTVIDPSDAIKSGMAANVAFDFQDQGLSKNTLVVPTNAVGEDGNGRFVFLIEEDGDGTKVKKQPVVIGNLSTEGFEILSGLSAGQKVATAGLQTLLDGQEVKLQ
ncbi:efflux RND transporter periplasmic adaptor subunit [Allomuricauda sp. SCSIO 65647]|uniref:efflux RND transporter periplasmic adaptor subunit n=1 Tax=Allomuricauda sp. SCSIO 65647 TaxID=2908843 RepID=UPI001F40A340|nr:efflux RND transporter periplasmic adaptor subunit [Muricauda sp. SCSIO 65647]UJH68382.1 efflux RND transporter periplasmic adaptor subunit [Muricauda sp. SCSIO 65647]